ncbi:MAG: hypothetical protein IJX86_07595 [Lachnospiraceae bacterium]|nr:hypothetical protein [Lachnospiraceae bacterium]MBR3683566.1 hypothetical protein [Lachnospiraceae bacterium]
MNGQKNSCKSKRTLVDEYVKEHNPYNQGDKLEYDIRGYSSYVKEHQIKVEEITPEIMNMFL